MNSGHVTEQFERIYGTTILECSECGEPIFEDCPAFVKSDERDEYYSARHAPSCEAKEECLG